MKKFYFFLHNLLDTLVTIVNVLLFSSFKSARNIKKLNAKRDRPVSILANGPSLNEIISTRRHLLLNTDLAAVNFFATTKEFFELKPKYYVLLDSNLFINEQIRTTNIYKDLIHNLNTVDWELWILLPYKFEKLLKKILTNKHIHYIPYNDTKVMGYRCIVNYFINKNLGLPSSLNVIIPALSILSNIGYNQIYLYGAEFSWTKLMDVDPQNNKVYRNDKHFYDKGERVKYYDKGWFLWALKGQISAMEAIDTLAVYFKRRNVRVINRTKGSFIDSFEYENPEFINE